MGWDIAIETEDMCSFISWIQKRNNDPYLGIISDLAGSRSSSRIFDSNLGPNVLHTADDTSIVKYRSQSLMIGRQRSFASDSSVG